MRAFFSAGLLTAALVAMAVPASGAILAQDNFDVAGPNTGTGWVVNSEWNGNGMVASGGIGFGDIGRYFATPINPFDHGSVFISLDFANLVPGNGDSWGGATIYGPGSHEIMFIGNPYPMNEYSAVVHNINGLSEQDRTLASTLPISAAGSKVTLQMDTSVPDEVTFRWWVGSNTDFNTPDDSLTVAAADYNYSDGWTHLYFRGDTGPIGDTGEFRLHGADNLVIATTAAEVGLTTSAVVPEPSTLWLAGLLAAGFGVVRTCRK